jgi:hypothetical protein
MSFSHKYLNPYPLPVLIEENICSVLVDVVQVESLGLLECDMIECYELCEQRDLGKAKLSLRLIKHHTMKTHG